MRRTYNLAMRLSFPLFPAIRMAMQSLVSTQWLADRIGSADLRILDASLFLPGSGRDARAEHEAAHIPGALFMDLDGLSDPDDPRPHMLPTSAQFASAMGRIGVSDTDEIVVYDNSPLHSAARAWWMLRALGAERVAMLDGGLPFWRAEGRALESGRVDAAPASFTASLDGGQVADTAFVRSILQSNREQVVDARSAARFAGEAKEPRPGIASGHIPGSLNLPYDRLFEPDNRFKHPEGLRTAFEAAGVDLARPMVATCGSGITAAVLLFAAHLLGRTDGTLYDGSWGEWGADPDTPKAVGQS